MWTGALDLKADTTRIQWLSKRQTSTNRPDAQQIIPLLGFRNGEVNRERCVVRESLVAVNGLTSTGPG